MIKQVGSTFSILNIIINAYNKFRFTKLITGILYFNIYSIILSPINLKIIFLIYQSTNITIVNYLRLCYDEVVKY